MELVENVIWMGEGVGRKRQNTVIWGKEGLKLLKKNCHMIFERSFKGGGELIFVTANSY